MSDSGKQIETNLRRATKYWLERVQPHICRRRLQGVELFMAMDAYARLRKVAGEALAWNATPAGLSSPVPAEAIPDFTKPDFSVPEELCNDGSVKAETLALIAAQMAGNRPATLGPAELIREAHELLMQAEGYLAALPKKKQGTESIMADFRNAFSKVTFEEIRASNAKDSGKLPLLPPSQEKRNDKLKTPLSANAIKAAIAQYLRRIIPAIDKAQYEREQRQEQALRARRPIPALDVPNQLTFEEWQQFNLREVDDCLQNRWILLQNLCQLRWERFEQHCDEQGGKAGTRKPPAPKAPPAKSAAPNTGKTPKTAAPKPRTVSKGPQ